jgi:hypothetical protein
MLQSSLSMMSEGPHVIVKLAPGITPEEACGARARALRFALDCYAEKKAASVTSTNGGDVMKGSSNDHARISIQE